MILVTGATGQLGAKAIDHLLTKGVKAANIAAFVRDAAKAQRLTEKGIQVRVGDYTDYDSLVNAFRGVDKLLLVSSNDRDAVENRTAHHINVIKAAKQANIKHIVYTSFVRKPTFAETAIASFQHAHVESEQFLKNSGLAYTILQNGIYLEMIPVFVGGNVAQTGVILFPAQSGKASWVLRDELAEATAHVLTTNEHENKIYALTNTESVSFDKIATDLSATLGKEITYSSPPVDEFESILKKAGVPDLYIGMFMMWAVAQAQDALDVEDTTLATFLGRKPTSVKQFINTIYG